MNILFYIFGFMFLAFIYVFLHGIFTSIPKGYHEKRKDVPGYSNR